MRLGEALLLVAVGCCLPRLAVGETAQVRVANFVELSARACERGSSSTYDGPNGKKLPCGEPIVNPPEGCRCAPYPPSYLQLRATVTNTLLDTTYDAKYGTPTEYKPVTLDPTRNASCTVVANVWNGADEGADAPTVVETTLVLKPDITYTLLLVGYLDRASYRPDSGETGLPGKFGELYAVLLEDVESPPRSHMGIMRLIHVSPATSQLVAQISDRGYKITQLADGGTPYVCKEPEECKNTRSHSCVPVKVEPVFPPAPPPPAATCDPTHRDEKGHYEGCPTFNPHTHKAYSCKDSAVTDSCRRNPECQRQPAPNNHNCNPDWYLGNRSTPPISQRSVCQRCKCPYKWMNYTTGKLATEDSYCNMNPLPWPGHPTTCPGMPVKRHGSRLDPCPGPDGHKPTTTCWRPEDPDDPGRWSDIYCDNCVTDSRPWEVKCYACPCPAGAPPPAPHPCGPWANPTKSHPRPREDKAHLILQKKFDGITQSTTAAIGVEEIPFVDIPPGAHTIEFLDGALPYPLHNPLKADFNMPVGKSITVFLHGLPPSNDYKDGHPTSPLGVDIVTSRTPHTFVQVKIASALEGLPVTVGANQTVGSATTSLKLRLGNARARKEVNIEAGHVDILRLDVPSYSHYRRGEWGSCAHYEIGWRSAQVASASMHSVTLDAQTNSPESVYVVLSGDKTDPKMHVYPNPPLPSAGELRGQAAVRVINAAYGVGSVTVQATGGGSARPVHPPASVADSIAFDSSSTAYVKIAAGTYQLHATFSSDGSLTGTLTDVHLYEGLIYTVIVISDSKLLLSLDRSYNSQATVKVRCAYLGGESERNSDSAALAPQITWSAARIEGAMPAQQPWVVRQGHVSEEYQSLTLSGTYDPSSKAYRVYLRLSISMRVDELAEEMECFTQLLPFDLESDNNTKRTFVVWGSSDTGRTCHVSTDSSTHDPMALPDPLKAGFRVLAGGAHKPSFRTAVANSADTIVVQSRTSSTPLLYTPVPPSISHITVTGAPDDSQLECDGNFNPGSLHSLFVRYGTRDGKTASWPPVLVVDANYGSYNSFQVRFLNALSSGLRAALTLQHGEQNLQLGQPVVGSSLYSEAMIHGKVRRTGTVTAHCFDTPGAWLQAWKSSEMSRTDVVLNTAPPETIKPNSCPPHCPLAEGASIVAPSRSSVLTVILGNDTSSAPPFLVTVEDDDAIPKLCTARVRLISLVSSGISATAKSGDAPEVKFDSPGLSPGSSPTASNWEPKVLRVGPDPWVFTITSPGASPKSHCAPVLQSGKCYTLYVARADVDDNGLPIYTCTPEVDEDHSSLVYVRLAHAAGDRGEYSMTLQYQDVDATESCVPVQHYPAAGVAHFGDQTGYKPVSVHGTTTYQITVQQTGSTLQAASASANVDLRAGTNWTIYILPAPDASTPVKLQAVADGTAASWKGSGDDVGLRLLNGLPGGSSSPRWSWKHCDIEDSDCANGAGTLTPVGDNSSRYQSAKIHGYSTLIPPWVRRKWRLGVQAVQGTRNCMAEFGTDYQMITSCDDGTTPVPLRSGSLYTVVLTDTGGEGSKQTLLMFQDRDGEPHSWCSQYCLLVVLSIVAGLTTLIVFAWCGTQWSSGTTWSIKLDRCLQWCERLCGRRAASLRSTREQADHAATERSNLGRSLMADSEGHAAMHGVGDHLARLGGVPSSSEDRSGGDMPRAVEETIGLGEDESATAEGKQALGIVGLARRHCFGDSQRAGLTVLVVFSAMTGVTFICHALADTLYRGPLPPPLSPCGTWDGMRHLGPGDHPCGRCLYGAEVSRYKVSADDLSGPHTSGPCDTLAARFGVPQFEIFNRNKSTTCCENPQLEVDDLVDICKAPTLEQWRAEGHPRKAPDKVIFSYIGSVGGALAPLPTWGGSCRGSKDVACLKDVDCPRGDVCENDRPLPESINVAAVGPVDDTTNNQGIFRITPPTTGIGGFAGNCSMQIDPQRAGRGVGDDADSRRLWLGTLLPLQPGFHDNGNWCKGLRRRRSTSSCTGALTPEEWGKNAAESLEKVFLRYRLDGLDMNIEVAPNKPSPREFANYICAMWRQLEARMGPGLTFTVTPYSLSWNAGIYQAVAAECLGLMTWANWQTYNDYSGHTLRHPEYTARAAKVFGWNKTTWGMSTEHGSQRPLASAAVSIAGQYPDARGAFVWTAESSAKCTPAWCTEDAVMAKMLGGLLAVGSKHSSACRC